MVMELSKSRHERSEERYRSESLVVKPVEGATGYLEEHDRRRESSRHQSKDEKKSHRDEKDHKSRDEDYAKSTLGSREKVVEDSEKERMPSRRKKEEVKEDRLKDRSRYKERETDHDDGKYRGRGLEKVGDRSHRGSGRNREVELDIQEHEYKKIKEKRRDGYKEWDRDMSKDRDRKKNRERDRERHTGHDKQREHEKVRERGPLDMEKGKQEVRAEEAGLEHHGENFRKREKSSRSDWEDAHDRSKGGVKRDKHDVQSEVRKEEEVGMQDKVSPSNEDAEKLALGKHPEGIFDGPEDKKGKLEDRILKMKEERLRKKSEGGSEILSWVVKSRKIEEKRNAEKLKAMHLSKIYDEQDMLGEEDIEGDVGDQQSTEGLAGVKVLHGLDKVIEGGAVVLTLEDQQILACGDINEDVDMLEHVEIGEQNRRDDAYKAAKKKTGIYDDKFIDEPGSEKKMLAQYDNPAADEGVTLDAHGHFTSAAEKKLEELRKRLLGASGLNQAEDLNSSVKIASDYYTHEEMLQFQKPKKKMSSRKRDKIDVDALEVEAISAGLGLNDLGSRHDARRKRAWEEEDRSEAERRSNAYQDAYSKADEAARALRMELAVAVQTEEDTPSFVDDAEELEKSLERARKLALKNQSEEATSRPEAIALIASVTATREPTDSFLPASEESVENKVVFTEMDEFVWGLQLDEETSEPTHENAFMEENEMPKVIQEVPGGDAGDWTEVKDSATDEQAKDVLDPVPDVTFHEAPVGKGLFGALKLLNHRGSLKQGPDLVGRNMDKKRSKLVGIYDDESFQHISIERTDEHGRKLTPKEAFRFISHKFHGKAPGKMKLEKRQKRYQDELKLKQMNNSDTPSQSVERMREALASSKTPYLVLSGHVKPGQSSDPSSGFATVEKDVPESLTPMLGDKKVEHFLGIKRKAEPSNLGISKKLKT